MALLALGVFLIPARAQTADALLDKLVEKGVLTVQEAKELRQETGQPPPAAAESKIGMPDWVTALRLHGDLRGRFEGFYSDNPAFVERNRFRYRLRFGATALFKENFEVGLRLTSSERAENFGGDPISGNADFKDNAAYKPIFIDRVYARWSPVPGPNWSSVTTFGKMENPFSFPAPGLGDAVFDPDYAPEGLSQQFKFSFTEQHSLRLNLAGFILDEVAREGNDAFMGGAQLRAESKWTPQLQTSAGITALAITGHDALLTVPTDTPYTGVPNINRGNTRTPIPTAGTRPGFGGELVHSFNPIVLDAGAVYSLDSAPLYPGSFPISLSGMYLHNPAAPERNTGWQVGIMFGKSGRKGQWDLAYRYKVLEADAWWEEVVDSDFGAFYQAPLPGSGFGAGYGPGTNVRGHIVRVNYSLYDFFTLGLSYFRTELIDEVPSGSNSDMGRLQLDAVWKF